MLRCLARVLWMEARALFLELAGWHPGRVTKGADRADRAWGIAAMSPTPRPSLGDISELQIQGANRCSQNSHPASTSHGAA
jgi:hypothetical protein